MGIYILKRVIQIVITLVIFQTLLFVILDAQPGDITLQYLSNPDIPVEVREQVRIRLGLDRPPVERYFRWLRNFATGELGNSYNHNRPVMDILVERAPRTLILFFTATVVSFYTGFALGKVLAWKRGTFFEYGATVVGVTLYTVFTPWFALLMIYFFGRRLGWLPVGKFLTPELWINSPVNANYIFHRLLLTGAAIGLIMIVITSITTKLSALWRQNIRWGGFLLTIGAAVAFWAFVPMGPTNVAVGTYAWDMAKHMILPVVVITLLGFAGTMLLTRNTMLETLREDYVMAARAKGLPERVVRDKHAARNAFLPVFTSLIMSLPFTLSGGIITETVFSWPGMGLTLLEAAQNEDIPMAMGALSFIGVLALLAHLVADVMYAFLDPRIRYQ